MQSLTLASLLVLLCLAPGYQGKGQRGGHNSHESHESHEEEDLHCVDNTGALEHFLDQKRHEHGAQIHLCYSGCCRDGCCDHDEEGEFWMATRHGWEHHGHRDRDDDDDKHHKGHHAYKIVAIVLSGVVGVIIVMATAFVCYKKKVVKRRGSVASTSCNDKVKKYLANDCPQGKDGPLPGVETMNPPAYYIATALPPMYNTDAKQPLPDALPTAPPSYSTIDIQEAAMGGNPTSFVIVKPAGNA